MLGPAPTPAAAPRRRNSRRTSSRIEARAGIAVPVPGAADIGAGLEDFYAKPEAAQPVELVQARDAGTDHDDVGLGDFPCRQC